MIIETIFLKLYLLQTGGQFANKVIMIKIEFARIFILIISLFNLSWAQVNCPSIDYRSHFSPTKNQGKNNLCWAMAGTALLEEVNCLVNEENCGRPLSVLDASSCHFRLGHEIEYGVPSWTFECARDQGVCEENLSPYLSLKINSPQVKKLKNAFNNLKYHPMGETENYDNRDDKEEYYRIIFSELKNIFVKLDYTFEEVKIEVNKSLDLIQLFDQLTVTKRCKQNRISFKSISNSFTAIFPNKAPLITKFYSEKSNQKNLQDKVQVYKNNISSEFSEQAHKIIVNKMSKGQSVAVGICLDEILWDYKAASFTSNTKCKYGHVIVLNGLRWNEENQSCEAHVLNSMGNEHRYQGWQSFEEITKATYLIEQIVLKNEK